MNIEQYRSRSGYSLSFSADHVFRWVRSADLVVVVLWDVDLGVGVWTIPAQQIDAWDADLIIEKQRKINLLFDRTSTLTARAVDDLSWRARFHHYDRLLAHAIRSLDYVDVNEGGIRAESTISLLMTDFLLMLGILREDDDDTIHVDGSFIKRMVSALFFLRDIDMELKGLFFAILNVAVLDHVREVSGGGLPVQLLEYSYRHLENIGRIVGFPDDLLGWLEEQPTGS